MAEEAFLRAKTEAAPARGAEPPPRAAPTGGDRGSEQGSPSRRYMKISPSLGIRFALAQEKGSGAVSRQSADLRCPTAV